MKNSDKHCDSTKECRDDVVAPGFIPHEIAPDNWPYFMDRSNPLSSKGIQTMEEYGDDMEMEEGAIIIQKDEGNSDGC